MNPPLKLLLFMAATVALLTFTDRASSAITRCPNCGSTPVPYPLSTSPTCGDQSYKIRCDSTNGTLQFDTLNNSYPITSINPSIQQLVIKPSPLLPNTCVSSDLVHEGVQTDRTRPFNITSSNTIMFMNCTSFMLGTPLNCSSSSLCHVYINSTRGVAPCGDASSSICCSFKAGGTTTSYMIRVREGGCRAYTSFVNLDSNLAVDRWPDPGLEMKWTLPREPQCVSQADCDGNSTCGSDPIVGGSVRRCFCMSGLEWDPIQGVCAKKVTCQNPSGCGGSTDRTALTAELLTSQKAIDFNRAADDVNLAIYVQRMMDEEKLMDTIDPMLRENVSNFEVDTMKALAFLAAGCLEDCRQNRPSMKEVTEEIEYIISIATAETVKK
ncbi:hypothetical protein EZV62_025712 [Acer yangbiense]|uniref:Wall-associated receptor kinase galacturonan-binding domain-containing protein n=1 Tax=Acer yangbiense TaxID=1000413 RepID=A0A5C7GZ93_9ROSI|nr:hypothetical protein EZV62_025712 [Acer yangbiense]